jgi:hypothetical protein
MGTPNDKYEQEADRVADRAKQLSVPQPSIAEGDPSKSAHSETVQPAPPPCPEEHETTEDEERSVEAVNCYPMCRDYDAGLIQTKQITPLFQRHDEQEEVSLQAKAAPEVTPVARAGIQPSQITGSKIGSQQRQGDPLSPSFCEEMERYFCQDFSNVRVHTNAASASLSRSLQARAFTHGSDIFFNSGQYNPSSSQGKRLIAHELTHVVQQSLSPGADK